MFRCTATMNYICNISEDVVDAVSFENVLAKCSIQNCSAERKFE